MRITGMTVYYEGNPLLTDAQGNNAAFQCPKCKHPVLLVTAGGTRGMSANSPAECPNSECSRKYVLSRVDAKEIHIEKIQKSEK